MKADIDAPTAGICPIADVASDGFKGPGLAKSDVVISTVDSGQRS
jgi:hypothetical protein